MFLEEVAEIMFAEVKLPSKLRSGDVGVVVEGYVLENVSYSSDFFLSGESICF